MSQYENQLYMMENPFYYPGMTPEEYEILIRSLAGRDILHKVLYGEIILVPREDRTKEYIFDFLGIKY